MSRPTRVRVLRRPDGWWHWWCPCCMGGDFGRSHAVILSEALMHVGWHQRADGA